MVKPIDRIMAPITRLAAPVTRLAAPITHIMAPITAGLNRPVRHLTREYTFARAKISSNGLRAWLATLPGSSASERLCYNPADHIWLTFDDYAAPAKVRQLLDLLAAKNVAAQFFLTGSWARKHPELVDQIRAAGHLVGSHGMEHKHLRRLTVPELHAELNDGLGTHHLRPPYGEFNPAARRVAQQLGQKIVHWTIDSQDWRGITSSHIQHNVLSRLHPGAVVLFHLHADNTLEILPELIDRIRAHGFTLPRLTSRPTQPAERHSTAK
jgi:peptidoglycan/xylan/chitin deacetylase (PgdA/CDA1 family)